MNLFPKEIKDLIRQDRKWLWLLFGMGGAIAFLVGGELVSLFLLGKVLFGQGLPTLTVGDRVITPYLENYPQSQLLVLLGVTFAGIVGLRYGFQSGYHYFALKWAGRVMARLQNKIMESLLFAPTSVFDKRRLGEIIHGLMEAPLGIIPAIDGVTSLMTSLFTTLMVGLALLYISPWMFLGAVTVGIPTVRLVSDPLQRKLRRLKKQLIEQRTRATEMAANVINGIRDIKALSTESQAATAFANKVDLGQSAHAYARFIKVMPGPTLQAIFQIAFAGVIVVSAFSISPEKLVAYLPTLGVLSYGLFRVYPAITQVSKAWLEIQHALPDIRVATEWATLPHDDLSGGTQQAPRRLDAIRFQGVSFAYDGATPAVSDLDFCIEAGKVTSLVGESGAGKSTLIDLMLKFRAPERGAIWLGDQNLRDVVRRSWLENAGVVRQEIFLFGGTLRENLLAWKPDASEEEMLSACRQAGALDFISGLPDGLGTVVGDRGVTFSGGERQRIAIARALLRNPQVLILDEALSALDGETEAEVLQSLLVDSPHRTVILVSHRLTTIQRSDHIIVLDRGRVVDQGTHEELLGRRGRYRELFSTQVGLSEVKASDGK